MKIPHMTKAESEGIPEYFELLGIKYSLVLDYFKLLGIKYSPVIDYFELLGIKYSLVLDYFELLGIKYSPFVICGNTQNIKISIVRLP